MTSENVKKSALHSNVNAYWETQAALIKAAPPEKREELLSALPPKTADLVRAGL